MFSLWVLSFTLFWLCMGVKGEDTVIVVDFFTDVRYDPPDAWFSQLNNPCETVDHYTAQINASASLTFTGAPRVVRSSRGELTQPRACGQATASRSAACATTRAG